MLKISRMQEWDDHSHATRHHSVQPHEQKAAAAAAEAEEEEEDSKAPDDDTHLTLRELIMSARPKSILLCPQSLYMSIHCYVLYRRISRRLGEAQKARDRFSNGPQEYEHVSEWDLELRATLSAPRGGSRRGRRRRMTVVKQEVEVVDQVVREDAEKFFHLGMRLMRNAGRDGRAAEVLDELRHHDCGRVVCCCSSSSRCYTPFCLEDPGKTDVSG
jgi:hypothetical protein